ncbi:MAG: PASTA domain-containing protein [Oscillospiraceae bacterium]|nr:PASTA domain-containing protein [Oscillospiraceae bacterium]
MATEKKMTSQRPDSSILRRTLILLVVCGIVAFALLAVRLYRLMITDHGMYEQMAIDQQTRETKVSANRGTIFDTNGNPLAVSATAYNVFISPVEMIKYNESPELIAKNLEALLGVSYDSVMEKSKKVESWYQVVATKIEPAEADLVREFKDSYNGVDANGKEYTGLRSVHLEVTSKRYYPYGSLACHVIGFVGTDNNGLMGLERVYNSYLEGTDGSVTRLAAQNGVGLLYENYENYNDAIDGGNVTLTLDTTIQGIAEKYLAQAMEENFVKDNGCVIVMEVKTGRILAMAGAETFDLNSPFTLTEDQLIELDYYVDEDEYKAERTKMLNAMWRNMSISDTYEPGSVFKTITLAMAFEEGVISENDDFYCGGKLTPDKVPGRTTDLNCWKRTGHGSQTPKEALMHSCNVAFTNIAFRVGAAKFYDYVEAFGFWNKTGIDLLGESSTRGLWWTEKAFTNPYNKSSLAAASFGQTANVTPLQMITGFCAAVNGGYLMEPYIVSEIKDGNGNIVYSKEPTVVRQVISEKTSRLVASYLEAVVGEEGGTGKTAYVPGLHIGGKTGTTTKTALQAATGNKEYMVSFCGMSPANDPEIAVLMVLDNPSQTSGIYVGGGVMVGPYVGKIFSEVMPYWGTEPDYTAEERQYLDVQVPRVIGDGVDDARAKLEAKGFTVQLMGEGTEITAQLPAPNVKIADGSKVIIYAGETPRGGTVLVPELHGLTAKQARQKLQNAGLFLETSGALPKSSNIVVQQQSVAAGEELEYGSVVKVILADKTSLGEY